MAEISAREGISGKYLGQIMLSLRSSKLVEALRGSQGGYFLARDPAAISVLDLVISLDGEVLDLAVSEGGASTRGNTGPMAREAWVRLKAAIEAALSSLTLEDLSKISISRDEAGDFSI
jgi:Rrf2 family protein